MTTNSKHIKEASSDLIAAFKADKIGQPLCSAMWSIIHAVEDLERDAREVSARLDKLEGTARPVETEDTMQDLENLLATIHHSGRHYQDRYGIAKACEDACKMILEERHQLSEALAESAKWQRGHEQAIKELVECRAEVERLKHSPILWKCIFCGNTCPGYYSYDAAIEYHRKHLATCEPYQSLLRAKGEADKLRVELSHITEVRLPTFYVMKDVYEKLQSEAEELRKEVERLNRRINHTSWECCCCHDSFPSEAAVLIHDRHCSKNPLVAEIAKLTGYVEEGRKLAEATADANKLTAYAYECKYYQCGPPELMAKNFLALIAPTPSPTTNETQTKENA